jgi:L-histidine Nalpha-methyltransferase
VTAAFNLNLLARINRELDADFDLTQFAHVARINHEARSVEMRSAFGARADRKHSGGQAARGISGGRDDLDREQPQVFGR